MTPEEERYYALRGHYARESQRPEYAGPEPAPEAGPEQESPPAPEPAKASFPKGKQAGG